MKRNKTSNSDAEPDLLGAIQQVSRERGLDTEVLIASIEEAILVAAQKYYGDTENLVSRFDRKKRAFEIVARKTVVETVSAAGAEIDLDSARRIDPEISIGAVLELPKDTVAIGRIAAQTAKLVITTRVRDLEDELLCEEYMKRRGEVVHATVKRIEGPDIIVDLGRIEAVIPRKEQNPKEHFDVGDQIRAVLVRVLKSARGVMIVLSRSDALFLQRLLEAEVPEIREGSVMIKAVVRDPGERAKVAVVSRGRDIDPVGACVGMKGTRIQAITREMRGERIDVVEWSNDPVEFVSSALNPAKTRRARIADEKGRIMWVLVDEKQLSLAIGKRGQNVRLASMLTGWHIDIRGPEAGERETFFDQALKDAQGSAAAAQVGQQETPPAADGSSPDAAAAVDKNGKKEDKSVLAEIENG